MAERSAHPIGFQTLTVSTTPLSLTVPATAGGAYLTCETNDVRYRLDGVDPTTTVGHVLTKGQLLTFESRDVLVGLRMIRSGAGDSVLSCSYFAGY